MSEIKRYVTPVFRLSFPNLFEPESFNGGPSKFGLTALWTPASFSEKDKERWRAMLGAMDAASKERFKMALKELPANYKRGIRDGAEKAELEGYGEGVKFASLTTKMRPGVVGPGSNNPPISQEEGNTDEIYPGCYCRATVNVYTYDNKGKGVALGLLNVKKVRDGDRLDSRTNAAEDFNDIEEDAFLDEGGDTDDFLD